eukprot:SAG31_NODE_1605_length_7765_cov_2.124315_5_plen_126_part_00
MAEGDIFPELLAHPIILRTLTRFLGPDFAMSDNGLCIKPPRMPSHVGWHRDATTWDWSRAEMDERWTAADRRFWEANRARPCTAPMAKIKVGDPIDRDCARACHFDLAARSSRPLTRCPPRGAHA